MSVDKRREDIRSKKTDKALNGAMNALLKTRDFRKITVQDLCEEALISRASFYAHFVDKYAYLEYWLMQFLPQDTIRNYSYKQTEAVVNHFIREHESIIRNLLGNMDSEGFAIVYRFVLSSLNVFTLKIGKETLDPEYIVFSNVYAGGMLHYLVWQLENKLPADVLPMNKYLFTIISSFEKSGYD